MPDIEFYVNDPMPDVGAYEEYVTESEQDPQEPKWTDGDGGVIADMQSVDDPNDEWAERTAIRNAKGSIEFLDRIVDSVEDIASQALAENHAPIPPKRTKLDPIRTRELGSDKWRGRTQVIGVTASLLGVNAKGRRRISMYNKGPNEVYIGHGADIKAESPGVFELPAQTATLWPYISIETQDDVWAVCAASESATVTFIEEFDLED